MKRFLIPIVAVLAIGLSACANGTYAKPGLAASVGLGEYGAVPSEASEAQPEAPLPVAPDASAPPSVHQSYADLRSREALRATADSQEILRLIDEALFSLQQDTTMSPEQKASLAADLIARKRELEASLESKRVPLPENPLDPMGWLYAALAVVTGIGGGAVATRKAKSALKAYDLARYRAILDGSLTEVSEAEIVAAVKATPLGVTKIAEAPTSV